MQKWFRSVAEKAGEAAGSYWAFLIALGIIIVWGATGPIFDYSDTWQLIINTGTTVVTFLMVFLVQNSQNREARITRLKLDELLRGVAGARTGLVALDHMTDAELDEVESEFERLHEKYAHLVADDLEAVRAEISERQAEQQRATD